jgi:hypothetical protein
MAWFIPLLIGLALNIIAYLIMPKPKTPKPEAAQDGEDPVAEAGKPLPVVSGSLTVKELNILWYGEKSTQIRTITEKGGKK